MPKKVITPNFFQRLAKGDDNIWRMARKPKRKRRETRVVHRVVAASGEGDPANDGTVPNTNPVSSPPASPASGSSVASVPGGSGMSYGGPTSITNPDSSASTTGMGPRTKGIPFIPAVVASASILAARGKLSAGPSARKNSKRDETTKRNNKAAANISVAWQHRGMEQVASSSNDNGGGPRPSNWKYVQLVVDPIFG